MAIYVPIVMYGLRLFIVVLQELHCLPNYLHVCMMRGVLPVRGDGPPKGEEAALPTTLLDLRGWGVLWGRGFEEAILVQTTVVECKNKNNKR